LVSFIFLFLSFGEHFRTSGDLSILIFCLSFAFVFSLLFEEQAEILSESQVSLAKFFSTKTFASFSLA